jgi:predicted transcriptional regulator
MLAIRLPEEIEQRLADLAAKTGRSKSFYAREPRIRSFVSSASTGVQSKTQRRGIVVLFQGVATSHCAAVDVLFSP